MGHITQRIRYYPLRFFGLVFLFSWLPWSVAAYLSYLPDMRQLTLVTALLGLLGPAVAAWVMLRTSGNSLLRQDYRSRLFALKGITPSRLLIMLGLILIPLLAATWLSVLSGHSASQFAFSTGFLPMLPLALIAALMEELGWRSYGVDSLRSVWGILLPTSLAFSGLWALWHLPLFFIHDTYQNQLWQAGGIYVANFFISMLPATILANWFYYRCQRSIPAAVLFHFALVMAAELMQTEPLTKCLWTMILLLVAALLIAIEQDLFLKAQPEN
ncbi:CAAX amino terminal protease self- immunity [Pragia fontium]|uniref:CPBP family intramembrane glutamic endopeptidase n=1 Tax=Pragia fontium TaxID=82985 RepID=UPI000E022F81|nr:CPBP family intramembrane glutamic endopeptidase [Pragia fontium]SUB81373.1 CAAX amino terminal protease self- immunity [Pragia fontium]